MIGIDVCFSFGRFVIATANNGLVLTTNQPANKVNFSNQNRRLLLRSFECTISSVALACKDDIVHSKPTIHS